MNTAGDTEVGDLDVDALLREMHVAEAPRQPPVPSKPDRGHPHGKGAYVHPLAPESGELLWSEGGEAAKPPREYTGVPPPPDTEAPPHGLDAGLYDLATASPAAILCAPVVVPEPPAAGSRSTPVPGPAEARRLVRWIEMVIRQHGGRVIGANLGSALANSNSALYRSIKTRYGGLTPLLSKFPDHFLLENDPPFNHVSLKNSPQAAAYHRTVRENAAMGLGPGGRHPDASLKSPADIEQDFVRSAMTILQEVPSMQLKAVELANMLRARMGTDALASVREHHGGLLSLLERHPELFLVDRIPKNDSVSLIASMPPMDFSVPGAVIGAEPLTLGGAGDEDMYGGSLTVPSRCLHVGNVSVSMTETELHAQFSAYGRIEAIKLVSQKGRRFAFVNFVSVPEAERAKVALSKVHMWRSNISFAKRETIAVQPRTDAEPIEVRRARWIKSRNFVPSRHLWIGCLFNTTKGKIHEAFSRYGEIEDVNFLKDRRCAFVDFKRMEDCVEAFKGMQNMRIGDQIIELGFGRARPDRGAVDLTPSMVGALTPNSAASAVAVQMAEIAGMFPAGQGPSARSVASLVRTDMEGGDEDGGDPWAGTALTASMTGTGPRLPTAHDGLPSGLGSPAGAMRYPMGVGYAPDMAPPHGYGRGAPPLPGHSPARVPRRWHDATPGSPPATMSATAASYAPPGHATPWMGPPARDTGTWPPQAALLSPVALAPPTRPPPGSWQEPGGFRSPGGGVDGPLSPPVRHRVPQYLASPGAALPGFPEKPAPMDGSEAEAASFRFVAGAPPAMPAAPPRPAVSEPLGLWHGVPPDGAVDGTALPGLWGDASASAALGGGHVAGYPPLTGGGDGYPLVPPPGIPHHAPSHPPGMDRGMPPGFPAPAYAPRYTAPMAEATSVLLATPATSWWPVPSRDQHIRAAIYAVLSRGRGELPLETFLNALGRALRMPVQVNAHSLAAFLAVYPDAVIANGAVVMVPSKAGSSYP